MKYFRKKSKKEKIEEASNELERKKIKIANKPTVFLIRWGSGYKLIMMDNKDPNKFTLV